MNYKKLLAMLCVIVPLLAFVWFSITMVGIAGTIKALLFAAAMLIASCVFAWGTMVLLGEIE